MYLLRALIFFSLLVSGMAVLAQTSDVNVPDEVKPFIESGSAAETVEKGDLNGDGRPDYILVYAKPPKPDDTFDDDDLRTTVVLIRDAAGKLSAAAANDAAAFCRSCGGVLGDPFQGVKIKGTSFTIMNYGGSSDRWSNEYTFSYSKRDNNWQLTRAEESSFSAFTPDKVKTKVLTPPKNYGLINFADFDPGAYEGKGKK